MQIKNKQHVEEAIKKGAWLDLGCGGIIRGPADITIGVDISDNGTAAHIIGDVAFESLPVDNSSIKRVLAYDFLEHIPMCIWKTLPHNKIERVTVMIDIFNEIYRVLEDGGEFEIYIPYGNTNPQIFQDPTHVSFWTLDTFNYFSGDYFGFHDVYGHTSRFKKKSMVTDAYGHVKVILVADKHSQGAYTL